MQSNLCLNYFPLLRANRTAVKKWSIYDVESASPELLMQNAESLAGRISLVHLQPFSWVELENTDRFYWQKLSTRVGFPKSYLASSNKAV